MFKHDPKIDGLGANWFTRLFPGRSRMRRVPQTITRVKPRQDVPSAWTGWAQRVFREPTTRRAPSRRAPSTATITSSGWGARPKRQSTGFFGWLFGG